MVTVLPLIGEYKSRGHGFKVGGKDLNGIESNYFAQKTMLCEIAARGCGRGGHNDNMEETFRECVDRKDLEGHRPKAVK